MNDKQFLGIIAALFGLPLLTAVTIRAIDSHTVTKAIEKVMAYNEAHPETPIEFSLNKK